MTDAIDRDQPSGHGVVTDYEKVAVFRTLAPEFGASPAALAHRYTLAMEGVDTVVLGRKNRAELNECIVAEAAGPLNKETIARIDASASGT